MAFITFLRSPLGGYAVAGLVAVGFIIRILFMEIHITAIEADNKTLKGNVTRLEDAVESEKEATRMVTGLLQKSVATGNQLLDRNEEINNDYIASLQENARLARDLEQSIRTRPVRAAGDVNDRTKRLLMDFWRQRGPDPGAPGTDLPADRAGGGANDGAAGGRTEPDRDQ